MKKQEFSAFQLHFCYYFWWSFVKAYNIDSMDGYSAKLLQFSKLVRDDINILQSGGKLLTDIRQPKTGEHELKEALNPVLKLVAADGHVPENLWISFRNFIIMRVKQTLEAFNAQYKDSASFEDEKEVILQYLVYFQRAPFTIQRIAELTADPKAYYKSTRKLLYAYEKLINVTDPDQK